MRLDSACAGHIVTMQSRPNGLGESGRFRLAKLALLDAMRPIACVIFSNGNWKLIYQHFCYEEDDDGSEKAPLRGYISGVTAAANIGILIVQSYLIFFLFCFLSWRVFSFYIRTIGGNLTAIWVFITLPSMPGAAAEGSSAGEIAPPGVLNA